jgi:flagellar export protein FliJ
VVRFREQKEKRALQGLARATDEASQARERLNQAEQQARLDGRAVSSAAEWVMAETARERALAEVKRAQDQFDQSSAAVDAAQVAWRSAHRQTEVVRRVADARRDEAIQAQLRRDTRALDELGAVLFGRKPG